MASSRPEPRDPSPEALDVLRAIRALNVTTDEPRHVAQVLLRLLGEEMPVDGTAVAVIDGGDFVVLDATGGLAPSMGARTPIREESLSAQAIAQRRTLSFAGEPGARVDQEYRARYDVRRGVVAPLIAGGAPVGILLAINPHAGEFTAGDVALISRLAELGSLAVQNALILARERQQARDATMLAAIVQELNQSLEFERVTDLVTGKAAEVLGLEGAALTLFDGASVWTAAASGLAASLFPANGLLTEGITRHVAEVRSIVRASDLAPRDAPGVRDATGLAAPLLVADRPIGALLVVASPARGFTDRDQDLLRALAAHAAVAIENARLYRAAAHTARHAETLSSVARSLSYAVDATTFFDELTRVAQEYLAADGISVYAIAQRTNAVRIAHMAGIGADTLADIASRAVEHPGIARLIVDGVEGFFPDVRGEGAATIWSTVPDTRIPADVVALARLPLIVEGRLQGAVTLRWSRRQEFPEDERALLRDFATQVALALRNAEQFEAERRSREVAEAAAVIARSAVATPTASEVARIALDAIDRAVPTAGKAIGLVDASRTTLRYLAASGSLAGLAQAAPAIGRSAASLPLLHGVQQVEREALVALEESGAIQPGCHLIPLLAHDQVLGVLWAQFPGTSVNLEAELDTLRNLAASLALAADVLVLNEEEQKRRAREHMLATALATMDQAVLIIGLDRRVLYANAAAVTEYGYPFDAVQDIPFDRLVASAAVARRVGAEAVAGSGGTVWEAEHTHRRRDGTTFPASVLLSYIRDARGVPIGQVVTVRNLTAERRIEEQLRQSEKLAALGELVAGVAHELNNPLAGISAFAQLLLEDPLDAEQHESVRLIKREADRAVGVIRDLLLFSRKTGPTQAMVDVNEMVELTLRLRGYGLRSAGIDVRVELDPDVPQVPGDSQRLQQVLLNLIINAEYALQRAEAKRLSVRSMRVQGGAAIVVEDSGLGMDEETRQRIFEPFFTTKPAGEGTGLGLSVSYGIVRAHGGYITAESTPGVGTIFRIELPAAPNRTSLATA